MKTVMYKRFIFCIFLQALFMASLLGQKYQNGTRLLKGAEVLSATPLQLDYVLNNLSDTANITVNLHEGKTHLILNDGSGKWREWWYYMGRWRVKSNGASPNGLDGSIQTKSGNEFLGSLLGINDGFIYSLDATPSDVGLTNKNATIRATGQGQSVMEASKTDSKGVTTSNVFVTPTDVSVINQKYDKGAVLKADTSSLTHWKTKQTGNDYWNFLSSLVDTTFYVKKRLKFDQAKTSIYAKAGDLHLSDQSGNFKLSDLVQKTVGTVTSVGLSLPTGVFSVSGSPITSSGTLSVTFNSQPKNTVLAAPLSASGAPVFRPLFEYDLPSINWVKLYNLPTTISGYGITDAVTRPEVRLMIGDTATVLRKLIKNKTITETDPVWTAAQGNYYTKANLQTSGGAQVHWDNISNKPVIGSVTSVGLSLPGIFTVSGSPVTTSGTLSATLVSQTKNMVFAAPVAGNGVPVFRALQETDLPDISWTKVTNRPSSVSGYGITDAYTKSESRTLVGDTANVLRQLIKNSSGGGNSLVTSNSGSIIFSGNGTTASPLTAATTNIAGNTNAVLVRDASGKPAASAYVTLNGKTLASPADFTVQAATDITVQSGNVPFNSRLWLSTSTGQSLLESNTSAYNQALSLQPNNVNLQVSDKVANSSFLLMTSTLATLQTSSEIRLMRTIQSDRRRTGIQITSGTSDIEGVWIQDGLENPPADNVLSGAYVRANKNMGLKLGFQGNTGAGDPSAYINISKAGSIQLSDMSGTIDIKYLTQLAKGIQSTIIVSMASSTITIDLSPVTPGNIYIVNFPLNGAKTIALTNTTVPANSLKEFEIWIPQGTTVQPVTWFSGITWLSGIPTMTAGKTSVFTFRTVDGVNFTGNMAYAF